MGQVLIYSLRDSGYFEWWTFPGDPCLLYADDMAIFLPDLSQLADVLRHIEWVGTFTGLCLNLEKTIAFDPTACSKFQHASITVGSTLVKYLRVFLGLGDLTKSNFEIPLCKACSMINKWSARSL